MLNLRGHTFLIRLCLCQVRFDLIKVHQAKRAINVGHFCLGSQNLLLLITIDAPISSFLHNRIFAQLEEFGELLILKTNLLHLQDDLLVCPVQAECDLFLHLFVTELFRVDKITWSKGRRAPVTTCGIRAQELLERGDRGGLSMIDLSVVDILQERAADIVSVQILLASILIYLMQAGLAVILGSDGRMSPPKR